MNQEKNKKKCNNLQRDKCNVQIKYYFRAKKGLSEKGVKTRGHWKYSRKE